MAAFQVKSNWQGNCVNEDIQSSLVFLLEPKDISNDFSLCSPTTNTAVNETGVSSMSTSDSTLVTPTTTSSSSKASAVTTPILHSTKTIKARNLFHSYTSSSLSTVTSHTTPTMSSTPFSLQPISVNRIRPNCPSKNLLTNVGDTILCYHCGNTISIQRSLKKNHRFDVGMSAAGSMLETGRTVFDLEKLADTGTIKESIFSLESTDREKSQFLFERQDFLTTMVRPPSKAHAHCRKDSFVDSFLSAITPTRTKNTTNLFDNKQKLDSNGSIRPRCSSGVSWSPYSDCDDLTKLFSPAVCHLQSEHNSLAQSWSKLDSLDVQEMLQLLESTTDVLYGVAPHTDTKANDVVCKDKEVYKETEKDEKSKEQDSPEIKSPPVPPRILRPRKQTKSTRRTKTSDKPDQATQRKAQQKGGRK